MYRPLVADTDNTQIDPVIGTNTGLGLIGMQERAKKLGGRLVISSQPNSGTRLEVRLPLAPPGTAGPERVLKQPLKI